VSEPKKMGDGMNAYIVFKVTTRVRISRLSVQKAAFIMANLNMLLKCILFKVACISVSELMLI